MKKLLLSGFALATLVAQAFAGDLPSTKAPPVFEPTPVVNWNGFYTGEHIGGIWTNADLNIAGAPGVTANPFMGFFGGTYGYSYQTGPWVLSLQGEYNVTNLNASTPFTFSERWLASVDGRVGYAMNNWLPYIIGGVAFTEARNWIGPTKFTADLTGFDIGVGAEYAISENWSVFAEYRYYDFGSAHWAAIPGTVAAGLPAHSLSKVDDTARVGINYRIGPDPLAFFSKL